MKTINTIYAILSALLVITMVFGLCSCGGSDMPKEATYHITTAIEYENGVKIDSCDASDLDQDIVISIEDENTIKMDFDQFTFYFTKNADGVFMGSMGGSIKSTMTWEGKTLTITDLDPDTGLPSDAIVFSR